jgi:hypothetical protein
VLPALAQARLDDVVLYGLDETLCPDGRFLEKTQQVDDLRPDGVQLSLEARCGWPRSSTVRSSCDTRPERRGEAQPPRVTDLPGTHQCQRQHDLVIPTILI